MPRLLILLVPLLSFLLAASACNGNGSESRSPTPEPGTTAQPIDPNEPIGVTPPDSVTEFLNQYADEQINQVECTLDADAGQIACGENGLYSPDPAPPDPNAVCAVLLVNDEPIAVTCTSQTPLTANYYVIP